LFGLKTTFYGALRGLMNIHGLQWRPRIAQ